MANALTAGQVQIGSSCRFSGATISPQGTATVTLASPTAEAVGTGQQAFTYGTGTSQIDILCAADYVLGNGAELTLDIYTGADLLNLFGGTAAFRHVKAIYFGLQSGGDTLGASIGNAALNGNVLFFGSQAATWTVGFGGAPLVGSKEPGVAVDATHKNVRIVNNGAVSAVLRLLLAGTSV